MVILRIPDRNSQQEQTGTLHKNMYILQIRNLYMESETIDRD